jgi:hypothetical protein
MTRIFTVIFAATWKNRAFDSYSPRTESDRREVADATTDNGEYVVITAYIVAHEVAQQTAANRLERD